MSNSIMAQSVLLISLEVCIVMLVFIFTMRSFDSKLRVGFVKWDFLIKKKKLLLLPEKPFW